MRAGVHRQDPDTELPGRSTYLRRLRRHLCQHRRETDRQPGGGAVQGRSRRIPLPHDRFRAEPVRAQRRGEPRGVPHLRAHTRAGCVERYIRGAHRRTRREERKRRGEPVRDRRRADRPGLLRPAADNPRRVAVLRDRPQVIGGAVDDLPGRAGASGPGQPRVSVRVHQKVVGAGGAGQAALERGRPRGDDDARLHRRTAGVRGATVPPRWGHGAQRGDGGGGGRVFRDGAGDATGRYRRGGRGLRRGLREDG